MKDYSWVIVRTRHALLKDMEIPGLCEAAVHLCLTFTSDARSQKTAPLNNHREDQLNNPASAGEEACPVAPQKMSSPFA